MENHKIIERNESDEQIRQSFRKVAWFYDIWGSFTESKAQQQVWEYANIQNGDKVLEVAVGTGSLFSKIVKRNRDGFTFGTDLSPEMIDQTKKKVKSRRNYSLNVESADHLSCETESIDVLLNNYMLDLLPEEKFKPILDEFHRVLKPTGKMVLSCMTYGPKWYHKFWSNLSRHFPELLTYCRPIDVTDHLIKSGFSITKKTFISQNTFPSEVILARKNQ